MKRQPSSGLLLIGVGTILSSMTIAGFVLGFLVDYWLDTPPIFLLLFGLLGLLGGTMKVYRLLTRPDDVDSC